MSAHDEALTTLETNVTRLVADFTALLTAAIVLVAEFDQIYDGPESGLSPIVGEVRALREAIYRARS